KPILTPSSAGEVEMVEYDTYQLSVSKPVLGNRFVHFYYIDPSGQDQFVFIHVGPLTKSSKTRRIVQVMVDTVPQVVHSNTSKYTIKKISNFGEPQNNAVCYPEHLRAFETDESKYRHVFNSPETSFGQPFLGDILNIESVIFGEGQAHFAEVKNNALYKLITKEAQEDALKSSEEIANAGGSFDSAAMFAAYQSYLQIYLDGITRKNYGWSYNSIASYDYYADVPNGQGVKQRQLEVSQYLIPGVQTVGDSVT